MHIRRGSRKFAAVLGIIAFIAGPILALNATVVSAQAPPSVPLVRFFGTITVNGSPAPAGASVTAQSAASASTTCGTSTVGANGSYSLDVQSISGCLGNQTFLVNGVAASQTGTPPAAQGSAQRLDLTVTGTGQATPRAATPPPPPTVSAPPPPPPAPPIVAATRAPTPAATTAPTVVVPAAPPNTGVGPGPTRSQAAPSVAQAPKLPNTGTGGLLAADAQTSSPLWALVAIGLGTMTLLISGAFVFRRSS